MKKKLIYGTLLGALLGVFCIIGASTRYKTDVSNIYLMSFWYNRVILGFIIGLLPSLKSLKTSLLRGLIIGAFVSFAFYSATEFFDLIGFFAGLIYGVIIEGVIFLLNKKNLL